MTAPCLRPLVQAATDIGREGRQHFQAMLKKKPGLSGRRSSVNGFVLYEPFMIKGQEEQS